MSRIGEKRRHAAEALGRPKKKRKSQSASLQPRSKPAKSRNTLSAHELTWKEIPTPERLDDAEGFFGLEEVDDVDVVREDQGKQARFLPRNPTQPPRVATGLSASNESQPLVEVLQDDRKWSGFSEEEEIKFSEGQQGGANATGRVHSKRNDGIDPLENELQSRVAYDVLDHHTEHHDVDTSEWSGLGLSSQSKFAIAGLGFPRPTAIQTAVIPEVFAGHDVIGKAVTGSGKTLAFAIPMFEHWLATQSAGPGAKSGDKKLPIGLILIPTRELVHQLARHFGALVEHATPRPKIVTVTGGLSIHKQQRQLVGADFIIATPGRLWEMMNDSEDLVAGLKRVKFLVVDEADRLLGEGHFKEVEEILDLLDRQVIDEEGNTSHAADPETEQSSRQVLVFSATLDKGLHRKLTSRSRRGTSESLNDRQSMDYLLQKLSFREATPKFIDVNPNSQMAQRLQEGLVECSGTEKDIYLYSILIQRPRAKVLVFTNSISSVRRITPLLQNLNLPASALHSSMPQKARLRNVERFSAPQSGGTILIATDVAARGLDIQNIDLILHYHVPRTADMYIHRSGRTARAEKAGESILVCSPDEVASVSKLILQVHREEAGSHHLQPIQIDRRLVARLSPRLVLSRQITETTLAKEKSGSQDGWLRTAAEELGVEYDSDDFAAEAARQSRGRGLAGKRAKEKEAGAVSRDEMAGWRARLKQLLGQHVNLGVSERYVAGGAVDVDALLALMDGEEGERTRFLTRRGNG